MKSALAETAYLQKKQPGTAELKSAAETVELAELVEIDEASCKQAESKAVAETVEVSSGDLRCWKRMQR